MRDHGLTWFSFVLVAWFVYGCVLVWQGVGKPRKPISRAVAVGSTVITAALVLGVAVVGA